jgi:hypothetical protein
MHAQTRSLPRALAATREAPGSAPRLPAAAPYVAGRCNIGRDEITVRRRWGHAGLAATLGLLVLLVATGAPREARLLLFFPAAAAAVGYLQAWLRFCAAFGLLGVFNFGRLGRHQRVLDAEALRRDRVRALGIAGASGLIGAVVALLAYLA